MLSDDVWQREARSAPVTVEDIIYVSYSRHLGLGWLESALLYHCAIMTCSNYLFADLLLFFLSPTLQQFGKILDVEIIFNERGSKVSQPEQSGSPVYFPSALVSLSPQPDN